jgi:hypothetical protein
MARLDAVVINLQLKTAEKMLKGKLLDFVQYGLLKDVLKVKQLDFICSYR